VSLTVLAAISTISWLTDTLTSYTVTGGGVHAVTLLKTAFTKETFWTFYRRKDVARYSFSFIIPLGHWTILFNE